MTTEERDALILEFGRAREQNQREHGEMMARMEAINGELSARIEATRAELIARIEAQRTELQAMRADFERAMRNQLLQGIGIAGAAAAAIIGTILSRGG